MNNIEILKNAIYEMQEQIEVYEEQGNVEEKEGLEEVQQAIENLIKENKELKEEKVLNEKILYFANNTLCNYHEGYQAGLHKETTATEIVAEERERFIIAQEIERLKNTINELHNKLDEGNKRVKDNYIPKSKIKEKIKELKEKQNNSDKYIFGYGIYFLQELLEE